MNHLEKIALSPALLRRAGNVAKQKASNILKATEVAPPGALKDLTTRMDKRLGQSEKFLSAANKKPQTPPKFKQVNQLSDPPKIKGVDPKHVDSVRTRLINKFEREGMSPSDAWEEAMSYTSIDKMYKELGMAGGKKKLVAATTWTGTKGYGKTKVASAFFGGFEKRAAERQEEDMEKQAFLGGVLQWGGRALGRMSRFANPFSRGAAQGLKTRVGVGANKSFAYSPKAVQSPAGQKMMASRGSRSMTAREAMGEARAEFGAARKGVSREDYLATDPKGQALAQKQQAIRDQATARARAKADARIARQDAAAARRTGQPPQQTVQPPQQTAQTTQQPRINRDPRLATNQGQPQPQPKPKPKRKQKTKKQPQQTQTTTTKTTKKTKKPPATKETPEKTMLQGAGDKAKEGWEGTKKWWGGLNPETKKYVKGAGLVGGGLAAGHALTRAGDNTVNYGPSYGV